MTYKELVEVVYRYPHIDLRVPRNEDMKFRVLVHYGKEPDVRALMDISVYHQPSGQNRGVVILNYDSSVFSENDKQVLKEYDVSVEEDIIPASVGKQM